MRTDVVVIGAGQAGLSAAYHLLRLGFPAYDGVVVLDRNVRPGGAWQHRWDTLTMADVHGIFRLPGMPFTEEPGKANEIVPRYFAEYEERFGIPVRRPVTVRSVSPDLTVETDAGVWQARAIVNATGTWDRPFVPRYPGQDTFRGRQLHTADYRGPSEFAGKHVVVVGGGHSAVQILAELAGVATTTWVTRRPPLWSTEFDGRSAVALVEERVRAGLPPRSVVSVTGLHLREQEQAAAEAGVYERLPMFDRIMPDGVAWSDRTSQRADVILWATGFRAALGHLAPLRLRESSGGIRMDGTRAVRDPRIHLVGYGPSASTIGANRAGRTAALEIRDLLSTAAAA
jgi:cation diffusion facilitator CzcD-associated flavoprotein CzcO